MQKKISLTAAPPIGFIRTLGKGDTIWIHAFAEGRADWPRYADAIACAVGRGAEVRRRWGF